MSTKVKNNHSPQHKADKSVRKRKNDPDDKNATQLKLDICKTSKRDNRGSKLNKLEL